MNDPKMTAFGKWLTAQTLRYREELHSVCANDKVGIETVKRKYGHLEAFTEVLNTFTELYNGDLSNFNVEYLNQKEESDNETTRPADGSEGEQVS